MALSVLDGMPLIPVGMAHRQNIPNIAAFGNTTLDAANEAAIMIGYVQTSDGGSHTIDTSGSSSLQWRTQTVTFANAGTTVKVGLAAVLTTAGPPARAAHASDIITFDVSKSMTGGGGGITTTAWQTHVPDAGTKTIANGDLVAFAIQMTARGGADSVVVQGEPSNTGLIMPNWTEFVGAAYGAQNRLPNVLITFSDGATGWFYGGYVATVSLTAQTWNSGSATKEYGNLINLPFPCKCYGIIANCNVGGDADFVLYSDPLGTPVAEKTVSVDANTIGTAASTTVGYLLFPSPFTLKAGTNYAAIAKPGGTNITMNYKTYNASTHRVTEGVGTGYAISRASGSFAAVNSSKDLFGIGLLVSAFEHGVQPQFQLGM